VTVRAILRASLVLAVAACIAWVARARAGDAPSSVIYPTQALPISFSHRLHAARGATCARCHPAAGASLRASDDLMPREAACTGEGCHTIDLAAAGAGCATCHVGWDGQGEPARVVVPAPNLKFTHKLHGERGMTCEGCHAVAQVDMATRAQLPRMASCLTCHDGAKAPAKCSVCHVAEAAGRLRTSFPEGQLVPSGSLGPGYEAHDATFRTDHRRAGRQKDACLQCHAERLCLDCHDGQLKPMDFHGNDYARLHAVDARRNTPDCASCHRAQSFCQGCHVRSGVSAGRGAGKPSDFAQDRATQPGAAQFHPPGFTGPRAGNAQHHAVAAQRNLRACASCHREDFCQRCHAGPGGGGDGAVTGGGPRGVSPHGRAWKGSRRCEALADKNPRLCLRCHLEGRTCDD
jgi:hypothetical protein